MVAIEETCKTCGGTVGVKIWDAEKGFKECRDCGKHSFYDNRYLRHT